MMMTALTETEEKTIAVRYINPGAPSLQTLETSRPCRIGGSLWGFGLGPAEYEAAESNALPIGSSSGFL
jgi:hypothetical protein